MTFHAYNFQSMQGVENTAACFVLTQDGQDLAFFRDDGWGGEVQIDLRPGCPSMSELRRILFVPCQKILITSDLCKWEKDLGPALLSCKTGEDLNAVLTHVDPLEFFFCHVANFVLSKPVSRRRIQEELPSKWWKPLPQGLTA